MAATNEAFLRFTKVFEMKKSLVFYSGFAAGFAWWFCRADTYNFKLMFRGQHLQICDANLPRESAYFMGFTLSLVPMTGNLLVKRLIQYKAVRYLSSSASVSAGFVVAPLLMALPFTSPIPLAFPMLQTVLKMPLLGYPTVQAMLYIPWFLGMTYFLIKHYDNVAPLYKECRVAIKQRLDEIDEESLDELSDAEVRIRKLRLEEEGSPDHLKAMNVYVFDSQQAILRARYRRMRPHADVSRGQGE